MYCYDTDVLSAVLRDAPASHVIRRMALTPPTEQCTTAVTLGELLYGVARRPSASFASRMWDLIATAGPILPFDEAAAERFGPLRAELERQGKRLDDADLRIAAIALSQDLTVVTGNERHFGRVPGLRIENWLTE